MLMDTCGDLASYFSSYANAHHVVICTNHTFSCSPTSSLTSCKTLVLSTTILLPTPCASGVTLCYQWRTALAS